MKTFPRRCAAAAGLAAAIAGCGTGDRREPGFAHQMERARAEYQWNKHAATFAESAAKDPAATSAQRVQAYRLSAEIRAHFGDQAGAQGKLEQALALSPDDFETLAQLAETTRDKPRLALSYAERAVRAADAAPAFRRAEITRLRAEILLDTGDEEGSRRELLAALELKPRDLETLRLLARVERGDRAAAESRARAADAAAAEAPEWLRPAALRFAARIWLDLEAYAEAADAYRRVLAVDPNDQAALFGLVHIEFMRPKAGLTRVATPDDKAPTFGPPWKEWTPETLARAERSNPDSPEAWRLRAAAALAQGRPKDALAAARRCADAIIRAPLWQQAAAERLAARMHLDLGSASDASLILARAVRLEPYSVHTLLMQSSLNISPYELPSAVTPLATSNRTINESMGYREIAEARWDLGDTEGAAAALAKALKANPKDDAALSFARRMRGLPH